MNSFAKMPSKQFFLSSLDANRTGNIYNWTINDVVFLAPKSDLRMTVLRATFPNSVYPINSTNNILYFIENAIDRQATIPPGYYTGISLGPAIIAAMNSVGLQTYTHTYDASNMIYTISTVGVLVYSISTGVSSINTLIGYTNTSATSSGGDLSSAEPINISGTSSVYFFTNVNIDSYSSYTSSRILCRIPLDETFGYEVFYEPSAPSTLELSVSSLPSIIIEMRDEKNNSWTLPSNTIVHLTILFEWY